MMDDIMGIPCPIESPQLREAVRRVLEQIQERHPKDFKRLRSLLEEIVPITPDEAEEGYMGYRSSRRKEVHGPETWGDEFDIELPSKVGLSECADLDETIALVAHEFGHVCTREIDLKRRGLANEEWASELAADWYAYKWGFGRQVARGHKNREWMHHGPGRGAIFEEGEVDGMIRYRVSRNFVVRYADKREQECWDAVKRLKKQQARQIFEGTLTVAEAERQIEALRQQYHNDQHTPPS